MLNSAQLNALNPAERERYSDLERMFASRGWKIFVALAKKNAAEGIQRAAFAQSWEQNRAAIGYSHAYNEMANLEVATLAEFEGKANEKLSVSDDVGVELFGTTDDEADV